MSPLRTFSIVAVIAALVLVAATSELDGTTGLVDIELDFSADS